MKTLTFALFTILATAALAQSPVGDVVGKLVVGYQGWFSAPGDGSPMDHWVHWSGQTPAPGHVTFELWPEVKEFQHTYQTQLGALGNGQPAKLFSSWDDQTVDTQFKWMAENNIDTAALQRFAGGVKRDTAYRQVLIYFFFCLRLTKPIPTRNQLNGIANKVRHAAEINKRKFYIMWDISGWNLFGTELLEDLNTNLKPAGLFNSSAYAHQNGKPVLCVWGLGFGDRSQDIQGMIHIVQELKKEGFYVIGGVDTHWLQDQKFRPVFLELNMLQPWTVGRYNDINGAKNHQNILKPDHEFLKQHNIDFQVVAFPGSSWSNFHPDKRNGCPRTHGDFMWQQFVNLRELNITNVYVAMFDEFDEGTAISKAAETKADIPHDQYFLTLDAEGVHVSSDFYLRLAGDGNRMVHGQIPLTMQHPTPHTK